MRRVVVTGIGGITALGEDWPTIRARMLKGETAVRTMNEWDRFQESRRGSPRRRLAFRSRTVIRAKTRTMGPVSQMAVYATERALADAHLTDDPVIQNGRTGHRLRLIIPEDYAPVIAFAELMTDCISRTLNATRLSQES